MTDKDKKVIEDFGKEWNRFSQVNEISNEELDYIFNGYFKIFPEDFFKDEAKIGFDMGCGSGRWAKYIAPKVTTLHCVDASSEALEIAKKNLSKYKSCNFICSKAEEFDLEDQSMDFGYSLGVLHHVTNTKGSLENCVAKLKKGAPFLLYLYYKFDNRSWLFKLVWRLSNIFRLIICRLPFSLKKLITDLIALIIYLPMSKLAFFVSKLGFNDSFLPLSFYKYSSFYTMRTDSLDRFGTKLEKRYTRKSMQELMIDSGLENIKFSETEPFWVAVGYKK